MDEIDHAQNYQAEHNADALREHWRNQPIGKGLSHCEECGNHTGKTPPGGTNLPTLY